MTTFKKGYKDDIGIDICLDFKVIFKPFETKVIDTGISIPTRLYRSVMMCSRTSAAKQGIIVNQCPIDPNYNGNIHIIAHNCSNNVVIFDPGKAFAQLYAFDCQEIPVEVEIKQSGSRSNNAFGSTDN